MWGRYSHRLCRRSHLAKTSACAANYRTQDKQVCVCARITLCPKTGARAEQGEEVNGGRGTREGRGSQKGRVATPLKLYPETDLPGRDATTTSIQYPARDGADLRDTDLPAESFSLSCVCATVSSSVGGHVTGTCRRSHSQPTRIQIYSPTHPRTIIHLPGLAARRALQH